MALSAMTGIGGSAGDKLSKNYVVPTGDVPSTMGGQASCTGDGVAQGQNLGQVCFTVSGMTGKVTLTITDVSPLAGGSYIFYKKGTLGGAVEPDPRNGAASGVICGTAADIDIPADSQYLFVMIGAVNEDNNAAFTHSTSIACGKPSPGAKGSVTAEFSGGGAVPAMAPQSGNSAPTAKARASAPAVSTAVARQSRFRLL
jgi:hypothetical protein